MSSVCHPQGMSIRTFRFGVLPIVSVLFLGALLLASCDSGADFSSLDELSPAGDQVAKIRAWYDEQTEFAFSEGLAKTSGDVDSLTLAAFVEKFPPDWNKAVLLSRKDGGRAMVATLGQYTDEKYDTTLHHVRTILVDLDSSGDVQSGNIVVFSSLDELSKDGFDTYARQYLTEDFGDIEMFVSRYTIQFEVVDAFVYRSGQIPLELSIGFSKREITSGTLGKLGSSASIINNSTPCYIFCYAVHFGWTCSGTPLPAGLGYSPASADQCGPSYYLNCVSTCFGSIGGSGGNGGGGGNDDDDSSQPPDEDECTCSNREQCDLAEEYNDSISWPCSKFKRIASEYRRGADGYESKHSPFGYISSSATRGFNRITSHFNTNYYITSAYRCPVGNNIVSDAPESQHIKGTAVDLNPPLSDLNIYDDVDNVPYWTLHYKERIVNVSKRNYGVTWSSLYEGPNHVHLDWR